ncbi:glycine betaine/carnitine/choline transport system permease protein OpuCB [Asanoa ishikariensis]|uniref:Osmoprotectant transport system permease protein n=1 Tax=Asanoa ishikariensis TaxID=137265 RepID=A0A1H3UWD1_9ACTN|nr:ABC transporter permease [Asanoa ishikariensis]GIF65115.1 glycine betaine/carnitine/choline transport system permease protein OpuCB [Asanoa ishikariensis]SDZ66301.1 osmoprotectant transport system permease protein [Asanoa ishikariensis]
MNIVQSAWVYLNDPLNWTNPGGILDRLGEHLTISAAAVAIGCVVALPLGVWLGHSGRGGGLVVLVSDLTLAIPTIALLTILPLTILGFGKPPIIVALAVFALPPLLSNAYTGIRQVDPETRDAAKGMGLSGMQLLRRVELPLAIPYLAAGFRTAAVQVVATTALASYVNGGGLGQIIASGFGLGISAAGGQILAGGVLVAALALAVEGILALVERLITPAPLRPLRRKTDRQTMATGAA